jgi:hypothetical protein
MLIPDGVWSHANLKKSMSWAKTKKARNPHLVKSPQFLEGDAVESHRVFISTFIQHSTVAHLALGDLLAARHGALARGDDWTRVRRNALGHYFGKGVEKFAFDYYAATQTVMTDEHLTLYRGIPKNTAETLFRDLAIPHYKAHLSLNPLSSWSDKDDLAIRFGARGGGAVIRFDIPKQAVFAHWQLDSLMERVLNRQCIQHAGKEVHEIGGEVIVWSPLCCIPITQENIHRDFTQSSKKETL